MPSTAAIYEYIDRVVHKWWIVVPVVIGAIRLFEWIFRHSKPILWITPKVRWSIAFGGLFVAQFLAYSSLRDETGSKEKALNADLQQLKTEVATLREALRQKEALIQEKERHIEDLKSKLANQTVKAKEPTPSYTSTSPTSTASFGSISIASQENVPSENPQLAYKLKVVLQTTARVDAVSLVLRCDGEISYGTHEAAGGPSFTIMDSSQVMPNREYLLSWSSPPFLPERAILVYLYSKSKIRVQSMKQGPF